MKVRSPTQISKKRSLNLRVSTWEKDSHGLFDYETTKLHIDQFSIQGACKLFRNFHTTETSLVSIDRIKRGVLPPEGFHFISSIMRVPNGNREEFLMGKPERPTCELTLKEANAEESNVLNTGTYLVVRHDKAASVQEGHTLKPGNHIKMGRVEFKILEVNSRPQSKAQYHMDSTLGEVHVAEKHVDGACKFCLVQQQTDDNFLISPCICKGSCSGVHVDCLRMWIDSKVKKEVYGIVTSYNFSKFQCQICTHPFPREVSRGQRRIQMFTITKPSKPYLILEGLNDRKDSKQEHCLHVICPESDVPVKIGRGHNCQIRLSDISVSRNHSEIKFLNGRFTLCDKGSKFGTLVELDAPLQLRDAVKLQIGRSLYEFSVI